MQPEVQATTRTPGPSTAEPVVKEWRNPRSPLASASRTVCSGTPSPRWTRSSYGLLASSDVDASVVIRLPAVESTADHVHLLLSGEPHEVDRIARHPDGQTGILLRVLHRIHQRVAIEHVHVHVKAGGAEERVQNRHHVGDAVFFHAAQSRGHQ